MPLHAGGDTLARLGLESFRQDSPFRQEADAALAGFRAVRRDLERQVLRGDLTPKVARARASEAAVELGRSLRHRSEDYSSVPRAFLDRLVEASEARRRSRESGSLEGLQRETNRLLRQVLVEQQIVNRSLEFEGNAFARPLAGGVPAPTLDGLLAFHERSARAGDDAAAEWARRQLEAMRPRVLGDEDQARIDGACDRPDRVNPRTVAAYLEARRGAEAIEQEAFVAEALAARDASALAAAFLLAREAPEGPTARWVRTVIESLKDFPDAALEDLRAWEAEVRRAEAEAARTGAEYAIALAEAEAALPGVSIPAAADLDRLRRVEARPVAAPGETIGLALDRRGLSPEEFEEVLSGTDDPWA